MKNAKLYFLATLAMLLGSVVSVWAEPDPNFHIYLCFGQSNMEGQGNIESQDKSVDSRFQVLCSYDNCGSRKKGSWYDATPPLSCCSGAHLGPVDYFGRTLVKKLPEHIKIGVSVVAIAGCDIQLFEKENYKNYRAESYMQGTIQSYGGNPYGRLVEMGKEAQKVGVIKGILLHQGETNTGQNNWPSRVKAVYNDLIKDLGLNADEVPLLVGEVVRTDQGGQCGSMNNIIANVPSTIPNSYVISAQGLGHKGDNLHFSSASYRTLGERYAEQMLKVLKYDDSGSSSGGQQGGGSSAEEQKPYQDAINIPGLLEGEHYDLGGNGNAYKDSDNENEGDAKFRIDEGVDIVKGGTGMAIGYTTSSEWLEYTINVEKTGTYDLTANASNGGGEIKFDVYVDDAKVASFTGDKTGSWDTYTALTTTSKEIKEGKHILKVKFESNNNNLDYIKFAEPDTTSQGGGQHGGGSQGGGTIIAAGEYPISYDVENTGAACEDPVSLNKNNLKSCKTLPNPFEWADGSGKVTDFCDWSCRRNEIKREIEYWEIGEKPTFDKLEASYSGGTLTVKVYNGSNTLTLTSKISVPSGNGPHPIVIGMDGNTGSLSSSYFSKCIQVPFTHSQIAEYNSGFGGGGRSQNDPFYKLYPGTFNTKADYCAWSWGISRLIDGLEIVKDKINADLGHIAVTGCSYAGKMALYAGAFDERVALTIAQESGGGGINSWRVSSEIGSDVEGISNTNYDWFLNSFKSNFQSQIDKLPYDHHELIAMIAPRAFLAFGNPDYVWLGDASGYASLKAAEEVWKAMGIEDRFGYVIEGGHSHCQASNNQNKAAQAYINKFLFGDNSQDTKIRTSKVTSNHSSGKYDWGNHKIVNNGCGATGVYDVESGSEEDNGCYLSQNRPNPTNDETMIDFAIVENAFVTIDLYNSLGVKVKNITSDDYQAGSYTLTFSVDNLPQGLYFYVMNANGFVDSKTLIVK
ncbi:MAG: carbohydrate-binding protein [Paludibacteraceae bacterium]|nr:carbohydrate-binding protein [Paludibacteraceae bacterium]